MKNLALMGAIALTGAVGFTACSSSNDVAEDINPNYNPETNAVKTEFVINVTQPGERTRMTAAAAGADAFQGIDNMKLLCMTGVPATGDNAITSAKKLTLTSYNSGPAIDGSDPTLTNSSSKVYTLYIPNGTTNFLFYATTYGIVGANNKFQYGSLQNNLDEATTVATETSPAETDIKFTLEPIVSTSDITTTTSSFYTSKTALENLLNDIAGAAYDKNGTSTDAADDIKWATIATETSTYGETYWQALRNAFLQFTNQVGTLSGDVRQGSSGAILNMVSDLFDAVADIYTSEQNADAKNVAKAVLDKICVYFTATNNNGTYTWTTRGYRASYPSDFPGNVKLPNGAAVLVWNSTNGFSYVTDGTMGVAATAAVSTACDKFTYPSELTYYCNSGLWQSTTSKAPSEYPTNSTAWITDGNWSGWTNTAVTAATRAVAMKDNITYGAAQLVSNVRLDDNVAVDADHALVDNRATITSNVEQNQTFYGTGDNAITLNVHGLLIGNQPIAAYYDYLPRTNDFSNVVYDNFSSGGVPVNTDAWLTPNYTLVLDNFVPNGDQGTVNIALEMSANKDFYGASGKIKAGQKFYLIGSLEVPAPVAPATSTLDWSKHTSFKSGDRGWGVDRVFIRDAKTTATFKLGANCLQKAYSTIPDLRSTQMVFGISVDLAWKTGLTFDVPIN